MRALSALQRSAGSLLLALSLSAGFSQTSNSENASVQLSATVQVSPARITLNWVAFTGATGYTIHRKAHTASSWGSSIGTVNGTTNTYQDNTVALNTLYEYRVTRAAPVGTGYGYVCSGIEVAATEYQGKIVLLVDNNVAGGISTQLTQLQNDLKADGWVVIRHDIATGSSVSSVRTLVAADHNADPTNTKAVYIIGHVAVPYSGNIAPDGHTDFHQGAWPCDGYYGELNGTWTDNTVNNVSGYLPNRNIPGDGKFDQDSYPNTVELQVGRVDFYDMPTFPSSETQLLNAYLTKAHSFRIKGFTPQVRAIMRDHLEDVPYPSAASGWISMPTMVGPANLTEIAYNNATWLQDLVNGQSYLWTYGSGGGLIENDNGTLMFNHTDKVMTTGGLTTTSWGGVFNMTYCSYTGDWNTRNNVMRAQLGSGNALTTVYAGSPNWWFHPMAMGKSIGHCGLLTMNNVSLYLPQSGSEFNPAPRSHLGLMGDPALRMLNLSMPSNLVVTNNAGNAAFTWTAAEGSPAGYHVYKFDANGVPSRVNTNLIAGTSFNSTQAYAAGAQYMVRATKIETTASGSWWNLSLGAMATAPASANVLVNVDVLLEGPYDPQSGQMTDNLRSGGLIPLAEPYTALGYTQVAGGGGETVAQSVLNTTGANAVVDWVRVELRSSSTPTTILATRQGLLQRDGDVVATDGTSALSFGLGAGNYHVAVRHRNHLGVMTGSAVALSGTAATVNFKGISLATYGTAAQNTIGGARALWMGNTTGNNAIKYTGTGNDRDPILTRVGSTTPNNTATGYYLEDTRLNGTVKYGGSGNDRDPVLVNVGSTTPNNTRTEQLP